MVRAGTAGTERALRRRGTIARLGSRSYATYDVSPNILGTRQRRAAVWPLPGLLAAWSRNSRSTAIVSLPRNPGGVRISGCEGTSAELHTRWLINPANLDASGSNRTIRTCMFNPFLCCNLDRSVNTSFLHSRDN